MRTQVDEIRLRNNQTGATIDISSRQSSHFLAAEIDWGAVEGTHHNYSFVGQIGTYVTGTTIAGREISIEAYVCAHDPEELTLYKRRLNAFFNPLYSVNLYYKDYFLTFKPLTSVKYNREWENNNTVFCKWLVEGYAEDPLFGDANESIVSGAAVISSWHFPWVLGTEEQTQEPPEDGKMTVLSYLAPSLTMTVTNYGAIEVGMRIVFKAARGTVVNPALWDVRTQQFVLINKTLVSGEEVEVNTNDGQKAVRGRVHDGEDKSNYYKYKDPDSSWLKIYPGTNTFRYTADEGEEDLEVTVYYYNRYLEVEEADE